MISHYWIISWKIEPRPDYISLR